jgi:uncharacterized protein (DUF58 family)
VHIELMGAVGGALGLPDPVVVEDAGLRRDRPVVAGPRPARRGVHRLPAFTATVEDPMGLASRRSTVGEPLRLTVPPRLEELASCAACSATGVKRGGGRRRLPTRSAWEFRGIRPHVRGEPLERVDWKSTAKTGDLMLREMEADTEDDLTVLLGAPPPKAGAARRGATSHDEAFETAVVAAGSMAAFTLRSGHAVSLLLPDAGLRGLRLTADAAGRRTLAAALAETQPGAIHGSGSSLSAMLGDKGRSRHHALAVVTTHVDFGLAAALERLRRRGPAVSVVHVLAGAHDDGRRHGGGASGDGPDAAALLAAAGVRYFPIASARELRAALAVGSGDRLRRAR